MCQRADGGHGVSMPLVSIGHNQGVIQMEMTLLFITFGFVRRTITQLEPQVMSFFKGQQQFKRGSTHKSTKVNGRELLAKGIVTEVSTDLLNL
jgi:hypothetical protein